MSHYNSDWLKPKVKQRRGRWLRKTYEQRPMTPVPSDDAFRAGWERCSPRSRQAVVRRAHGMDAENIAESLGMSVDGVRKRISECYQYLPLARYHAFEKGYLVSMMVGKLGLRE